MRFGARSKRGAKDQVFHAETHEMAHRKTHSQTYASSDAVADAVADAIADAISDGEIVAKNLESIEFPNAIPDGISVVRANLSNFQTDDAKPHRRTNPS